VVAVVALSAAIAVVFLIQAVHVIGSGDTVPFFSRTRRRPDQGISGARRWLAAALTGVPGCAMVGILTVATVENPMIRKSLLADPGNAVGGLALCSLGWSGVLWPGWVVRSLRRAYPTADVNLERPSVVPLIRMLAAMNLAAGLWLLSLLG
jgi:hypothetical protein